MAMIRLPCNGCRRRFPNLFLGVCIAAVSLFCVNVIWGWIAGDSSGVVSQGGSGFGLLNSELGRFGSQGTPKRKRKFRFDEEEQEDIVCKMPRLTLDTDANRFAFYKMKPLQCEGDYLFFHENGTIHINETVLAGWTLSKCEYTSIQWESDVNYVMKKIFDRTEPPFAVPVPYDFYRVQCYLSNSDKVKARKLLTVGSSNKLKNSDLNKQNTIHVHDTGAKNTINIRRLLDYGNDRNLRNNKRKLLSDNRVLLESAADVNRNEFHHPPMLGGLGMPDIAIPANLRRPESALLPDVDEPRNENEAGLDSEEAEDQKGVADENWDDPEGDPDEDEIFQYPSYRDEVIEGEFPSYEYLGHTPSTGDFDQYFAQIAVQEELIERIKSTRPKRNSLQMNVLIFAMDSMSHLSYQRLLPQTYAFLRDELKAVILHSYNIVGDATTAAMLPFLTGRNETELPEVRRGRVGSTYVDRFPFVWNKFEQSGYVTLFAEDQPAMGTFQLRFNGFEEKPVDHYIRPFWQAIHHAHVHKKSPEWCLGGHEEHTYLLNYLMDYMEKYSDVPKFGMGFTGDLTHADNNPAQYADKDVVRMLKRLRAGGHLENTLLIVMGDHGARYSKVRGTVQGKLEERLPFISLTFPEKFRIEHPKLYTNVEKNADRLTTPFDIHETMLDLLDITRAERPVKYKQRGISLLHEIPVNRTCASAHVAMHWCACLHQESVQINHPLVKEAANQIVAYINGLTENHKDLCERLVLKEIRDAQLVIPNEKVLKFMLSNPDERITNFSSSIALDVVHYQLAIQTKPNDGLYEATVQYNEKEDSWQVYSEISRINVYGNQPHCIVQKLPELRKYCYCTKQLPNR